MKLVRFVKSPWVIGLALGAIALLLEAQPASSQVLGGGAGGGKAVTVGGGGAVGGAKAGGAGGAKAGGVGGAKGGIGGTGTGAIALPSPNAVTPSAANPFSVNYSSVYAAGLATNKQIVAGNFTLDVGGGGTTGGGTGTTGGAGGGAAKGGGGATGGFTSTFNTGGQIVTMKAGSMTTPLYPNISSTVPGIRSTGQIQTNTQPGFSTFQQGVPRAPAYVTQIDFQRLPPLTQPPPLQASVRGLLDRSSVLPSGKNIQVSVDKGVVVLQGTVTTDKERRVAETMIRMESGVRGVDNRIVVSNPNKK